MRVLEPLIVPSSDKIEPFHELPPSKADEERANPSLDQFEAPPQIDSVNMTFSSSPVQYPASSSPAPVMSKPKRKLFQTLEVQHAAPKRPRLVGGFEAEDDYHGTDVGGLNQTPYTQMHNAETPGVKFGHEVVAKQATYDRQSDHTTSSANPRLPTMPALGASRLAKKVVQLQTCGGQTISIPVRSRSAAQSYEELIAQRSLTAAGRAKKAYYGIEIHKLMDEVRIQRELDEAAIEAQKQQELPQSIETPVLVASNQPQLAGAHQMWTEKYRARKFTDLVGDERTHRSVLRWLKGWDETVFPRVAKLKPKKIYEDFDPDKQRRKILLLTGSPGLGKTTLAHVCAKQAGYEVLEINASDDRSRDVVKGRIKDALGTETVRGVREAGKARKAGRPVCVVVDEVDGVVTGSGGSGGEGGFMKALIDLVLLDQKNSGLTSGGRNKGKGDKFRLMRPLIMICNDVYAPSLRPLRQSGLAEIIHVRKPSLDKVISRLKSIFEKESIPCDNDAVRRLCESSWGLGTRKQNSRGGRGAGDGDIRGVLVEGEWVAHKLRASASEQSRLTRKWIETHLGQATGSQKGLGRGGVREIVERIFIEGAGLPNLPASLSKDDARLVAESKLNPVGVSDLRKRTAIGGLREMMNTCGEHERLMTDCFATYPTQIFQDDTVLSKPNACYEWLHFHDSISSRIFAGQEWELNPYLGTSACGFHDLFAALDKGSKGWTDEKTNNEEIDEDVHPFAGLKADFTAYEAEKSNRATITQMRSGFSAPLLRLFSSVDTIAIELVPNVAKMLAPEVKPVVVGGSGGSTSMASVRRESEKNCVQNAVRVMHGLGVEFEKIRIEHEGGGAHSNGGYAFRMEPYVSTVSPEEGFGLILMFYSPLDVLATYHLNTPAVASISTLSSKLQSGITSSTPSAPAPVRYAVRQVLSQELAKEKILQSNLARQARVSSLIHAPAAGTGQISDIDDLESNKENQTSQTGRKSENNSQAKSRPPSIPAMTAPLIKKDFFGRPIIPLTPNHPTNKPQGDSGSTTDQNPHSSGPSRSRHVRHKSQSAHQDFNETDDGRPTSRTWVSFHEGYSNAVRKFISFTEFMDGF